MKARFAIAILAIAILCACALAQENTTGYWLKKGYELSANGSNEQALQAYEKVISIDPENSLAWINKANALARLNRTFESNQAYHKALVITDKMLKADSRNATLWLGKGILLNNIGDVEGAVSAFDNASKIDPENEMAWKMKGVLLDRDLHIDDAVKAYDAALRIDPRDAEVWNLKGDALKAIGRHAEADAAYSRARELGATPIQQGLLTINNITATGKDRFIELTTGGNLTRSFFNWSLSDGENHSVVIPTFTIKPGIRLRLHFGPGSSNETDIFLNAGFTLNETGGNLTLKDLSGKQEMFMAYWEPEKDLAGKNMSRLVRKEAGSGPFVAERIEIRPKTALNNHSNMNVQQENSSEGWYSKGQELDRNGSYNESAQAYKKALNLANVTLKTNPNDAATWQTKGLVLERLYRIDEAAIAFGKVIELEPENAFAWLHKGKALDLIAGRLQGRERTDGLEDAIRAYDKAIEINPNYGEAWKDKGYSLGSLAIFTKNLSTYNESLAAFDKAIKQIPSNDTRNLALAWDGRANTLAGLGNALNDSGKQDEARGKREEALNDYGRAVELDSNFTGLEARINSAGLLADLGRYNESLAAYDNAIETKPNFPPGDNSMYVAIILAGKGDVLEKIGRHEDALKAYEKSIELFPENALAWKGRGDALNSTGKYDEAISAYDKAIELTPQPGLLNAYAWHGKGLALKAIGRSSEADAAFAKAKELGHQ